MRNLLGEWIVDGDVAILLAAVVTGLLALLMAWWRRRRGAGAGGMMASFVRSAFVVLTIMLVVRSLLVEPYRVASDSMIPTVDSGEIIFVDKKAYGARVPWLGWHITSGRAPERGDIAVFRSPWDARYTLVKRILALPGDRVDYEDGRFRINGEAVLSTFAGHLEDGEAGVLEVYEERLGGVSYHTTAARGAPPATVEFTVPAGQLFVVGDHRAVSDDSRRRGTVPAENVVGRVFAVWRDRGVRRF